MSGNKSKPSKTGAEEVKVPEEEIKTEEAKETKESEFSSKVSKYLKKSGNKKKKGVDPIIAVSAIVLLLCCCIVIGYTVYDKCFADHTEPNVEYGDTVEVRYVGSFYAYYDADGSVIFDTNREDVANSTTYSFSHEWSKPEEFALYEVTVGSGGSLAMFENALIGHHPGETVRVEIPAGSGYELKGGYHTGSKTGNTVSTQRTFDTTDAFKEFFGVDALTTGINTVVSPYGWEADYIVGADGKVEVTYKAAVGEYSKTGSDVKYNVTSVTSTTITYDLVFEWKGKMLQTYDADGNTIYITSINADDTNKFEYKIKTGTTSSDDREVSGAQLFFVIEIVQYKSSS